MKVFKISYIYFLSIQLVLSYSIVIKIYPKSRCLCIEIVKKNFQCCKLLLDKLISIKLGNGILIFFFLHYGILHSVHFSPKNHCSNVSL